MTNSVMNDRIYIRYECVSLTISYHLYFQSIPNVLSMLHQGLAGRVQSKESYFMFKCTFWNFVVVFHLKNVFSSFLFLFLMKYQITATEY